LQKPSKGTLIAVEAKHFTSLRTDEPLVRISFENGNWVAIDPAEKRGLIVFVGHPKSLVDRITSLEIVSIANRVAFAIANEFHPENHPIAGQL
jgi:hypothetical protein